MNIKIFKYSLFALVSPFWVFSQVGIGTTSPATGVVLHIDGAKDNQTTVTSSQMANDVVVTNTGALGIGTNSVDASAAVEIKSTTRGMKIPMMTNAERDVFTTNNAPIDGLTIYSTTDRCMQTYISSNNPKWNCNNVKPDAVVDMQNLQKNSFTFNNSEGSAASEVCIGSICAKHSGDNTGAYLLLRSNTGSSLQYSSVAIYRLYIDANSIPQMTVDNSVKNSSGGILASGGASRPLVNIGTSYPNVTNNSDEMNRKLTFINGRVNENEIAIYQVNDGSTGRNYRITLTMIKVSDTGAANTDGNSKYLVNVEQISNGQFKYSITGSGRTYGQPYSDPDFLSNPYVGGLTNGN